MSSPPYPAEPTHADPDWNENDNEANVARYGIDFRDIVSGFATQHVRASLDDGSGGIAIFEIEGLLFEVRYRFAETFLITAARLASTNARQTYERTLRSG